MSNITNQQRREVAARLRAEDKPALHENQQFMNVFEDFVAETTDIWDYRETRATPEGFNAYCDLLADLIDRPTCRDVSDNDEFFVCSVCGADADLSEFEIGNYCANCGAEVVE